MLGLASPDRDIRFSTTSPYPVTACTFNSGGEIAEAVAYAFEEILPERVYPQTLKIGALVNFQPGSRWAFQLGGGGGWGNPLERDPAAVLDDVLDGYVTVEGARRDYGVVLTPDGAGVDPEATRAERKKDSR